MTTFQYKGIHYPVAGLLPTTEPIEKRLLFALATYISSGKGSRYFGHAESAYCLTLSYAGCSCGWLALKVASQELVHPEKSADLLLVDEFKKYLSWVAFNQAVDGY